MPYANFKTIDDIKNKFDVRILSRDSLFPDAGERERIRVGARLSESLKENVPLALNINTEKARSELIIAPVLLEVRRLSEKQVSFFSGVEFDVEHPLDGGENLSGVIDYFIKSSNHILVVDAKKGDLEQGFNQLAVELIAMDKYDDGPWKVLHGAVTSGDFWRFGRLDREEKLLRKDMNGYVLPSNLDELFSILIGILEGETG